MYGPKLIAKLAEKKYRQEYSSFVVDGKKGVSDALKSGLTVLQLVFSDRFLASQQDYASTPEIKAFFDREAALVISEDIFSRMIDSATPQGVAAVVRMPSNSPEFFATAQTLVVLEDIRDPGNLGTMIRTADWFGVDAIILIGGADPYQPKVVRSSMGSIFRLPIYQTHTGVSDLQTLKNQGFEIVVTRPEGGSTKVFDGSSQKSCFVFGNESLGTSSAIDAVADSTLSLPKFGQAESLNVAVSFGIVLYENKRLRLKASGQ